MSSLIPIFQGKLIPWAQDDLSRRLIVARSRYHRADLPYGVEVAKKKIVGKRVLVRTRDDGVQKIVRARWPEAGLHELFIPKLVCVLKGVTDYRAGEYVITCGEGHFILMPPSMPNTAGEIPHLEGEHLQYGSCDLLQLIICRRSVKCSLSYSRGEKHWGVHPTNCEVFHPQICNLFNLFVDEAIHPQEGSDMLCNQLLASALVLLLREIQAGRQVKAPIIEPENKGGDDLMLQIQDYLKTHLYQSLTIESVAQHMYMSPSQFTRYIRRETGQSFVEILTGYRIEEAKRLLKDVDWSIAAVGRHVGFQSSPYFMTLFKRLTGTSPGEYRNTLKNDLKK